MKAILFLLVIFLVQAIQTVTARNHNDPAPAECHSNAPTICLQNYNNESQISQYMHYLERTYPSIAQVNLTGFSYEKRKIPAIHITSNELPTDKKPSILIDAGIHAREWIAPAVALCTIHELVENSEAYKSLIDNVNWYIIPLLNPDGYMYSMMKDRMWRKNRSKHGSRFCTGVDLNRNFEFYFGGSGTTKKPCEETFIGKGPFSEPETRALRDFARKIPNLRLYLTLHSYGKYFLYPWGYTSNIPNDWKDLDRLARLASSALSRVYGTRYQIGSSTRLLGVAAGGSDDWMKARLGVKYSYTLELPGGGYEGFDLPASRIQGVCKETFEGIKAMGEFIAKENFVKS